MIKAKEFVVAIEFKEGPWVTPRKYTVTYMGNVSNVKRFLYLHNSNTGEEWAINLGQVRTINYNNKDK